MTARNNSAETRIHADRCTPGGLAGLDAMDWALRASLVALAITTLWFVVIVLKPLPTGESQPSPDIPKLVVARGGIATIDVREARLASLNAGGNFFASDRKNWPVHQVRADDTNTEDPPGRSVNHSPTVNVVNNQDIDSIEIANNAPTAIRKRLDQIKLRGVYVVRGESIAMIGKKTNSRSETYRVGDTFDDGEWRLVAIDNILDRVILNRSGLNFELKLYDTGADAYAGASPRTSISATNAPGDVEIDFTSLDKVATELREAGLPRDQINELITLAQADPTDEPDSDKVDGADDAETKPAVTVPAMPPGMIQLFRAMAEGSRNVVATPPTPEPADDDKTDDNKADDNKADDTTEADSSDKKEKNS